MYNANFLLFQNNKVASAQGKIDDLNAELAAEVSFVGSGYMNNRHLIKISIVIHFQRAHYKRKSVDAQQAIERYELDRISNAPSYYAILNCEKRSTAAELKKEYHKLMKILHTDVATGNWVCIWSLFSVKLNPAMAPPKLRYSFSELVEQILSAQNYFELLNLTVTRSYTDKRCKAEGAEIYKKLRGYIQVNAKLKLKAEERLEDAMKILGNNYTHIL